MNIENPQILYMILIVPCIFGLTLIGEGISRIIHEEKGGAVSIIFGFLSIALAVFVYLFFSSNLVASLPI